jgi:hypothetical protein
LHKIARLPRAKTLAARLSRIRSYTHIDNDEHFIFAGPVLKCHPTTESPLRELAEIVHFD